MWMGHSCVHRGLLSRMWEHVTESGKQSLSIYIEMCLCQCLMFMHVSIHEFMQQMFIKDLPYVWNKVLQANVESLISMHSQST